MRFSGCSSYVCSSVPPSQPGGSFDSPIPPFEPYRLTHVDNARISRGRVAYHANRQTLRAIEQEIGVPEAVMVAIYGHETNYGSFTVDFNIIRSMSTLAFESSRRELFEHVLIAAHKIVKNELT